MQEVITVPANIRTEFDTSKINTGMNTVEEKIKDQQILGDNPYIPVADERAVNVVKTIKETSKFYQTEKSAGNAGFTNVWELKSSDESFLLGETELYLVSNDIKDPSVFKGATLITVSGEEILVSDPFPAEEDSMYVAGDERGYVMIVREDISTEDATLSAGSYIMKDTVVKIIATSAIFPVQ